nr:hypothetical protein [Tanacetum cinerariifolium]
LVLTETGVGMPTEVGCVKCHCNGVVVSGMPANVGVIKCVDRVDEVIRNIGLSSRDISSHSAHKLQRLPSLQEMRNSKSQEERLNKATRQPKEHCFQKSPKTKRKPSDRKAV